MKKFLPLAVALASAALLTACGGGGGDNIPPFVATTDVKAAVTANTVAAVAGQSFDFNSGVTALGTATPTTIAINAPASGSTTNTFAVQSTEGHASGNLTFGSCIFTVTDSTYPPLHPLAQGQVTEVEQCELNVTVRGASVEGGATARPVSFTLDNSTSSPEQLPVDIQDDGTVVVNGTPVGEAEVAATTGARGG